MADALQQEATDVLVRLIRHNTVNPPGNEGPAQEELAAYLRAAGFEVELLGHIEGRPNLIARLRGAAPGPTLCFLSHVDTVLAHADEWTHDPWSGHVDEDGILWGRGAIDMKSQTACEVVAAVSLAREGWRPAAGDLLVVAVIDEEVGGAEGAMWLCEHHPEKVRCDYLVNEGAGSVFAAAGERAYGVCVAEKGVFRFRLTTDGVAAHASNPKLGSNSLLKMAPLLQAMADRDATFDVTEPPRALLAALGIEIEGDAEGALATLAARDPDLALLVAPMLQVTLAPTQIWASEKLNVLPARTVLAVDCRTPPGMGKEAALARITEVLGPDGYTLEFTEEVVGNGSPADTPLMDAIRSFMALEEPTARVLPTMLPAFTDSRTFRDTFPDVVAYGFFPMAHMTLAESFPLMHALDERIDTRDLGLATRCYRHIATELLGSA
jgi:acetylornithine deacetylase/succinyl-diaminopimelate desuccinylase-like protein